MHRNDLAHVSTDNYLDIETSFTRASGLVSGVADVLAAYTASESVDLTEIDPESLAGIANGIDDSCRQMKESFYALMALYLAQKKVDSEQ